MKHRTRDENKTRGIYIFATFLGRGYDLKLGADACVLVLATDKGFKWSEVNQMLGRGCRSFGISRGVYFTSLFPKNYNMESQLALNEKNYYDTHKIVGRLLETYKNIPVEKRSVLATAFNGDTWKTTESTFKAKHSAAAALIYAKA